MSSKSKRSSVRTRESGITVDTSNVNDSTTSSFSPNSSNSTRWSRVQEKEQLSNLNDRLATYIERVRNLETENARLHVQIRDVEVVERREKDDLTSRYEAKIDDIRNHLEAITREKAKLEIERSKAVDAHNELKPRVADLEKKLKRAENDNSIAFQNFQEMTARLNNAENARNIAENENKLLKKELADLQKQLSTLQQQLEDEVVLRTELENKLVTYKDDLEFAKRSHTKQLEEFRRKRQVEMTSFSNEVETKYQTKFQEQLQNMRDDFDKRIAQSRAEVDELYKAKLAEAAEAAKHNRDAASSLREDLARYRAKMVEMENTIAGHNAAVANYTKRIADLEAQLRRIQDENDIRIQQRDDRIQALEKEIAAMLNDYQDLMGVKVQLDTELQAYQKLLESEETRLHITPTQSPNSSNVSQAHVSFDDTVNSTFRRGVKRKRLDQENYYNFDQQARTFKSSSHSDCDIEIDGMDVDGKFIRIVNKSDEDLSIGDWKIQSTAGEQMVTFKFRSRQSIKGGKSITLWSSDAGQEHNPPNIVMRNQRWPAGDAVRVELMNVDDAVVAWRECILEHTFNRFEDSSLRPEERCSIM